MKHKSFRVLTLLLVLLLSLTNCRNQVVEKVGILPDRSTQLVAHNSEDPEETSEGKSWDVQNADEIRLYTSEMTITTQPSSHYFNNIPYLYRTFSQSDGSTTYSLEHIEADGNLTQLHAISVPSGSYFHYSPTGTIAAYETRIDNRLTLMLVDLATNEERVLWQSDEVSILDQLHISAQLTCHWSPDGSTLLFMPLCYANEATFPEEQTDKTESSGLESTPTTSNSDTEESSLIESSVNIDDTSIEDFSTDIDTESSVPTDTPETVPLDALSPQEKMQLVYDLLPSFPIIYTYQIEQKQMQSFLISVDDYPLYDSDSQPMICATQDGNHFFIYFNSPWDPNLAHYLDLTSLLHYSTPLCDYLPTFTQLGSRPLFHDQLLYLHADSIGIMVLDPAKGSLEALYPFNDPIHSFTIYDNALIVAQPASAGGGVDVTAYLLNLDTKQSVLLYHYNETYSPFINHMEMSQDGMHLMIEQLPSTYRTQKQLIQLSFK